MPEIPDELEVERLRNLILGFGWEIKKQETMTDRLELTIVKERESAEKGPSAGPT